MLGRALVANAMSDAEAALGALQPLHRCIQGMQPSPEHLTPFHAAYLQACALPTAWCIWPRGPSPAHETCSVSPIHELVCTACTLVHE
jgi:hypothetical protein